MHGLSYAVPGALKRLAHGGPRVADGNITAGDIGEKGKVFHAFAKAFQDWFYVHASTIRGILGFCKPFGAGVHSGLVLGGRPLPGTLRMASRADSSYRASLETGFIPALKIRKFAALRLIPNISAISLAVKNFFPFTITPFISAIISKYLIVVIDYILIN
jgi:hypothetical protein